MTIQRQTPIVLFVALFLATALVPTLRADIYQWEWIDPDDPSQGKQPSTTLCPDGAGLTPAPSMYAYYKDLTQAYLIGFNLTDAYFYAAKLTDADMTGANLTKADFRSATLTNSNFTGANLTSAIFPGVTLTTANFSGSTIVGASFSDTTDNGFTCAQFESTASYTSGELAGVNLSRNNLTSWNFAGKNLTNASFWQATLTTANFSGSSIAGTSFYDTTDSGFTRIQFESTASYTSGELIGINLGSNNLNGWNFAGKNLSGANFYEATLTNANLFGANLTNASFQYTKFFGADFSGTTIAGANFYSGYSWLPGTRISREQFESTASYTTGELQEINLQYYNLTEWNFTGKNLTGTDFGNATLTNADFSGSTIAEARFSSTTDSGFTKAQFELTASYTTGELTGVYLDHNDLAGWNFAIKNLAGANLSSSILAEADFLGATISGVSFWYTTDLGFTREQFESTASYKTGELTGIGLGDNDLTDWNFAGKDLTNTNFHSATLTNADFSGSTIAEARFSSTTDKGFTQSQFESTASYVTGDLTGIALSYNKLTGWNFADKNLTEAFIYEASLIDVNLTGANLTDAVFQNTFITRTNMKGANLTRASFSDATLIDADFSGANLTDTSFRYATLTDVNLINANLFDADFTQANLEGTDARGAISMVYTEALSTRNFIQPNGHVEGLNIVWGNSFRIRDYNGSLGITIEDELTIDADSTMIVELEDDDWGSTITFDPGIDVCFDGTLEIELRGGFSPTPGYHQWQLFDFSDVVPSGDFHTYLLPDVTGSEWDTSELLSSGMLSLVVSPPGDANCDGIVDDGDAGILADNWLTLSGATWGMGDFNGDGRVDDIDATIMASNWLRTVIPSASVPEPSTAILLSIATLGLLLFRLRR